MSSTESTCFQETPFTENAFKELLEPIILPPNVSAEALAKIIAAIILRKSYESSSAWSKWILLAALDELLGKSAPILNEKQLHELQGNQFEDSAVTSSGLEFETEFEVSPIPPFAGSVNNCSCKVSITSPSVCSCNNMKDSQIPEEGKENSIDEGISSENSDIKYNAEECTATFEKDSETHKNLSETSSSDSSPLSSKCESNDNLSYPAKMDCTTSATQTDTIILVDKAVATDDHDTLLCVRNQVDKAVSTEHDTFSCLKSLADKAVSTDPDAFSCLRSLADKAVSTDPDAFLCLRNCHSVLSTRDQSTQVYIYRLVKISGVSKLYHRKFYRNNWLAKIEGRIVKLFYGKPLIGHKTTLETPNIPLEPLPFYYGRDPRICKPDDQLDLGSISEFIDQNSSSTTSPFVETSQKEEYNSLEEYFTDERSNCKRVRFLSYLEDYNMDLNNH